MAGERVDIQHAKTEKSRIRVSPRESPWLLLYGWSCLLLLKTVVKVTRLNLAYSRPRIEPITAKLLYHCSIIDYPMQVTLKYFENIFIFLNTAGKIWRISFEKRPKSKLLFVKPTVTKSAKVLVRTAFHEKQNHKNLKVAFNRVYDRDQVMRECDGLMINGKKIKMIAATRKSPSRSRSPLQRWNSALYFLQKNFASSMF